MSKTFLDQIPPEAGRKYSITANPDGTSKITDVTEYVQEGTPWGASDATQAMRMEDYDPDEDGVIGLAQGGTGATTAAAARAALGAAVTAKVKAKTLAAGNWSEGAITVSDADILATSPGDVRISQTADADEFEAWAAAMPQVTGQAAGSIMITARGYVPTIDIPIILEVRS